MRVIVNTEFYKQMDNFNANDIHAFMKITKLVGEKKSLLLQANKQALKVIYGIKEETLEKFEVLNILNFSNDLTVSVSDAYVKLFNKNADYVKTFRNKNKDIIIQSEPVVKILVNDELKAKQNIDYDVVKDMFNKMTEGTKIPKIDIINESRKKQIKQLYDRRPKHYDINNYKDFYVAYFDIVKEDKNILDGWMNTSSNSWFQPNFSYIMKENTFANSVEKFERNQNVNN